MEREERKNGQVHIRGGRKGGGGEDEWTSVVSAIAIRLPVVGSGLRFNTHVVGSGIYFQLTHGGEAALTSACASMQQSFVSLDVLQEACLT